MVLFNYSTRELTAKIVYYGPGLCGKTTNLQYIHANLPDGVKGRMLSLATKTDRTLFFDFLPIDLGEIRGMKTRVQLYTVPGQVFYNETRKLVLKGADGIVFVADSQEQMMGANVESFRNLEDNLRGHGIRLQDTPHVIQFNKRDLPRLANIEELNSAINRYNAPFYESVATTGIGVQDTLKAIVKLVLLHLTRKYETRTDPRAASVERGERPPTSPPPAPPVISPEAVRPRAAAPERPAPARAPVGAAAAPPAAIHSIPLSEFETPLSRASSIPVSPAFEPPARAGAARTAVPPPPDFRGRGGPDPAPPSEELSFDAGEIDGLMEEVGDFGDPSPQADDVDWGAPLKDVADDGPLALQAGPLPAQAPSAESVAEPVPPLAPEPWAGVPESEPAPAEEIPFELPGVPADEPRAWMPVSAPRPERAAARDPQFEVDLGFDPAWQPEEAGEFAPAESPPQHASEMPETETIPLEPIDLALAAEAETGSAAFEEPLAASVEPTPIPVRHGEPSTPPEDAEPVVLEEVAAGDQLFEDPGLEIARLGAGDAREIVVPVEIVEGVSVRRFRLSLRLRLDPLD